jgi:hypothetical protein
MKKLLIGFGVGALLLMVACGGVLLWAFQSTASHQGLFFTAVQSGDPLQVTALMHESLAAEVDEPVLAVWIAAVRKELGPVTGFAGFNTAANATADGTRLESKATVNFERGTAQSELVFLNDKLVSFKVQSDKLKDWRQGPPATAVYEELGRTFLASFLSGNADETFAMMHEGLQKELPKDQLRAMMDRVSGQTGALDKIAFDVSKFAVNGADKVPTLKLYYQLACQKAAAKAEVTVQFVDLKGHLLGFNLEGAE